MRNYPSVKVTGRDISFIDGVFCKLPKEYLKDSNKGLLKNFFKPIIENSSSDDIIYGIDPLGFSYIIIDFLCYVGVVTDKKHRGKYNNLSKKYPKNKFDLEFMKKQIQFEYDLLNFKHYVPIEIVTQNFHEMRGLNSKISGNIDKIMGIEDEAEWDDKFEQQSETVKKIYVGSRLLKFILDNFKFYIPDFFENLNMKYERSFVAHRSVSKIVKIYRNDFKTGRADIEFKGSSGGRINGDKEYFEILVKILIENALKYSEFPKRIGPKVIISETTNEISIQVHSYGRAIPDTEKPYLFSKGFRASINKQSQEGTGMGLYNAKQIAKHFGAAIEFSNQDVTKNDEVEIAWNIFTLKLNKLNKTKSS
ncbi:HAMP domain-containing sensor histidine kinase [Gaetbulibacter jejuensis]|uniref:sensor histidine kinase n=1 Tax=Gaetbulibacter jejuensis TaxID=584607 RepID=UPI00300A2B9F